MSPTTNFLTETYVEFHQESVTEQRFPEELDFDGAVIGRTLFNACRGKVDHSEREGLSSGLSSSSMCQDRTGQPVANRGKSHDGTGNPLWKVTKFRDNSENEQIWTLVDREREQILADFQAEIEKYEFQADYDRRSMQKLTETIESQKEEIRRAQQGWTTTDEINNFFTNNYWSKNWMFVKLMRKVSMKWENWRNVRAQESTQLRGENWSRI